MKRSCKCPPPVFPTCVAPNPPLSLPSLTHINTRTSTHLRRKHLCHVELILLVEVRGVHVALWTPNVHCSPTQVQLLRGHFFGQFHQPDFNINLLCNTTRCLTLCMCMRCVCISSCACVNVSIYVCRSVCLASNKQQKNTACSINDNTGLLVTRTDLLHQSCSLCLESGRRGPRLPCVIQ
jgi:hypothetical protein